MSTAADESAPGRHRREVHHVVVFADGPGGGNPAPIVLDAEGMTEAEMRGVAAETRLESGFVFPSESVDDDIALRFWVPRHEMEMCGHVTLGTLWLLAQRGVFETPSSVRIATRSGPVLGRIAADGSLQISQPPATVTRVDEIGSLLQALRIDEGDLAGGPVLNSSTSRVKTLIPLRDASVLDALHPDLDLMESTCDTVGSTGLYPYAVTGDREFNARQFPRSSGYAEDPATGIAATALVGGLASTGALPLDERDVTVRQGVAMGRPSRITVRLDLDGTDIAALWLGGPVSHAAHADGP